MNEINDGRYNNKDESDEKKKKNDTDEKGKEVNINVNKNGNNNIKEENVNIRKEKGDNIVEENDTEVEVDFHAAISREVVDTIYNKVNNGLIFIDTPSDFGNNEVRGG